MKAYSVTIAHPLGESQLVTVAPTLPSAVAFLITGLAEANEWEHKELRSILAQELPGTPILPAKATGDKFPDLYANDED